MLHTKSIFCFIQMQILFIITILKASYSDLIFEETITSMLKYLNDHITDITKKYKIYFSSPTNQFYI